MKTPTALFFILICTVGGGGAIAAQQDTADNGPASQDTCIEALEERIAELEARIAALEKRNQPDFKVFEPKAPASVTPQSDWVAHEFDGQTFYLIPLNEEYEELK